jgi:hypothetical protein
MSISIAYCHVYCHIYFHAYFYVYCCACYHAYCHGYSLTTSIITNNDIIGDNIAEGVAAIINEFSLRDRIGYFVLDNASNNDTYVEALADKFSFNTRYRRLRCAGHIINLVAKALLFGDNIGTFEAEVNTPKELIDELKLWRKRGPIGKIYNIVTYIGLND